MKMSSKTLVFIVLQCFAHHALCKQSLTYENYKVYRVKPNSQSALQYLNEIENSANESYNFWSDIKGLRHNVDVMVAPNIEKDFLSQINRLGNSNEAKVLIENVQDVINEQRGNSNNRKILLDTNRTMDWNDYYRYDEINNWLENLARNYPERVTLLKIGKSYEGRDIVGVHVMYKNAKMNQNEKPAIFLEGGIHAREWISVSTVTYQLNQILFSEDQNVRDVVEQYDWYIFPILNPDGYEYTFTNNRMWRKTRKPHGLGGMCRGADPNRNWDFNWHKGDMNYVVACSDRYAGPSAFSEPEIKAMSYFLNTIGHKLYAYIGHHAYSQLLLIPYGDSSEHRDNYDDLMTVGKRVTEKIKQRYGTEFQVGNIVDLLYVAGGNSMDWVKNKFKTRITYTYELRDKGNYGFLLPSDQIIQSGEEIMDALLTMLTEFANLP